MTDLQNERVFGLDSLRTKTIRTKKDLIKNYQNMIDELNKNEQPDNTPLHELDEKELLFKNLNNSRLIELELSNSIEEAEYGDSETELEQINAETMKDCQVKFDWVDDKYLIIDTPLIFKNAERYSNDKELWLLANQIDCVRKYYENTKDMKLSTLIHSPYWMFCIRKAAKNNLAKTADSDNIEIKKISNTVAKFLFLSDAPDVKRDATLCKVVENIEDEGMRFVITEEVNACEFIEKFRNS